MRKRGTYQLKVGRCIRISRVLIRMSHPRKPFVARFNHILFRGLGDLEDGVIVVSNLDRHHDFKLTMAVP